MKTQERVTESDFSITIKSFRDLVLQRLRGREVCEKIRRRS